MRVIFLNRFYWPDESATAQLLTDLAEGLAARGCEVTVITGPSGHPEAAIPLRNGVRIHRTHSTRWGRRSLAGRAIDFITFLIAARGVLRRHVQAGDAVVPMTDPPMLGTMAARAVGSRGARVWHWTQDVYPEVAMAALGGNPLARGVLGLLRGPRNRAWLGSAGCVVLGRDMAALVESAGMPADRVVAIPNWAPAGLHAVPEGGAARMREEWGLGDAFIVGYSGNLGRVHELDSLLDVAAALAGEPRIAFVLVGGGAQRDGLERAARERGLRNVRFRPPQPRARLAVSLAAADIQLVTLKPGFEAVVFPSKLHGITAVGRPVLFVGPTGSEIAAIVTGSGMGLAFAPGDTAGIAEGIRELAADPARCKAMGEASLRHHAAGGGLQGAVEAWDRLLASAPETARTKSREAGHRSGGRADP